MLLFRLPLVLFNGLLALYWYFLLRRIFQSNWISLLACSLILLSPILIGITQIVNPDALLWSTAFTAVASFIAFIMYRKWYDVLVAGLFLGLALLSKYTTILLVPYWFALALIFLGYKYSELVQEKKFAKVALRLMAGFVLAVILGAIVYALGMPAVFSKKFQEILALNDVFREMYPYLKIIAYVTAGIFLDAAILKSWILKKILWPLNFSGSRDIDFQPSWHWLFSLSSS